MQLASHTSFSVVGCSTQAYASRSGSEVTQSGLDAALMLMAGWGSVSCVHELDISSVLMASRLSLMIGNEVLKNGHKHCHSAEGAIV
jgi:hypothetical protein